MKVIDGLSGRGGGGSRDPTRACGKASPDLGPTARKLSACRHGFAWARSSSAEREAQRALGCEGIWKLARDVSIRDSASRGRGLRRLPLTERSTMKMHNPPHPGEIIRKLCIEPLGLAVTRAAKGHGLSRKTHQHMIKG